MLILFDIDATLLTSSGAGFRSMLDAGRELFGPSFHDPGVDYSGRLDPLIIAELLAANGLPSTPDSHDRFRAAYAGRLQARLADGDRCDALPGAHELVSALEGRPGVSLGLLTGNFPETGALKLRHAGLDPARFPVQAWGCDAQNDPPTRDDLGRVAITRWTPREGAAHPSRVVSIGDTPHDVRCALVNGCRALAVATGRHTLEDLTAAGAHLAVPRLTETQRLVDWILSRRRG